MVAIVDKLNFSSDLIEVYKNPSAEAWGGACVALNGRRRLGFRLIQDRCFLLSA